MCCAVQELRNKSCWLLGKEVSICALRGLVRTVYQFCTFLTKVCGWHEIFKKWIISREVELLMFRFTEKYTTEIFISQHHIPGTANGRENYWNLKRLCRSKLVNNILEAINVMTSSSTADQRLIFHKGHSLLLTVGNSKCQQHSDLEMPYWKCITL
jgi:hypothetical protein